MDFNRFSDKLATFTFSVPSLTGIFNSVFQNVAIQN